MDAQTHTCQPTFTLSSISLGLGLSSVTVVIIVRPSVPRHGSRRALARPQIKRDLDLSALTSQALEARCLHGHQNDTVSDLLPSVPT